MTPKHPLLFWLTAAATLLALAVIVLGAWTRLRDAGLGCPDWPGCYGFLTPPLQAEHVNQANALFPNHPVDVDRAWPEMVHRYFASGLGALIVLIAVMAAVARRRIQAIPSALPWLLVALVVVQGMFGMWTVTWKLWPQVVTLHLLGGMATAALLWLLALRLGWTAPRGPHEVPSFKFGIAVVVVLILQIAVGGWTTSNYAALACPDFPTCQGQWLPPMNVAEGFNLTQALGPNYQGGKLSNEARVAIQMTHREGAVLVLLMVGTLALRLIAGSDPLLRQLGGMLLLLLFGQWALGISNVVFSLPLGVATAHNGVAAVLLLTLVSVNYRLFLHQQRIPS